MTTEKMFPDGFVPRKDEIETYRRLYLEIPGFSLADRINSLDISTLSDKAVAQLCRRNLSDTGVGLKEGSWLSPVDERYRSASFALQLQLNELRARENVFRVECQSEGNINAYKTIRSLFIRAIGQKIAVEYIRRELNRTTPEEIARQRHEDEERTRAWQEKRKRREKIYAIAKEHPGFVDDMRFDEEYYIETYNLTEGDLAELELMVKEEEQEYRRRSNIPRDCIEKYNYRSGHYIVPILAEKLRMIRKQLKIMQRDFAKRIGYLNANKYAKYEKGELGNPSYRGRMELIKDVVEAVGANPYWLQEDREETLYEWTEKAAETVGEAQGLEMPMFATREVIQNWWREKGQELKQL